MKTPYPFDRVQTLMYRAVDGVLTYEEEKELRALLAREQPLAASWDWARLVEYGQISVGMRLWKREHESAGVHA